MAARASLFRLTGHGHHRVGFIELFFDLVFVFAITQLSHGLLAHLTLLGVAETTVLMVAVWWLWISTSWVTNWLDPALVSVRLLLLAMMAGIAEGGQTAFTWTGPYGGGKSSAALLLASLVGGTDEQRKLAATPGADLHGRPTKRDRRQMGRFTGEG